MEAYKKAYKTIGTTATLNWQGSKLNQILNLFAFWSKETDTDYYASLEDDSPYYSLTEKE